MILRSGVDHEALPGVLIQDGHEFDLTAVFGRVKEKVDTPHMAGIACLQTRASVLTRAHLKAAALSLPWRNLKACLLPQAMHPLFVHQSASAAAMLCSPTFAPEQARDAATAKARVLLGELVHTANQRSVFVRLPRGVTLRRTRLPERLAGPPLTDAEHALYVAHGIAAARRA